MSLAGCGSESVTEGATESSKSKPTEQVSVTTESSKETVKPTERPSLLPEGTYEINLPDDIAIEYNGKTISIVNTTGMAIVDGFDIEPTKTSCNVKTEDYEKYTNGLPQTYTVKLADVITEDNYLSIADKCYNDDYTDIRLQSIDIGEQDRAEIPEVKVLGFGKNTTFEDVYNVLGNPSSIGGDSKGYDMCELQYKDIVFNDVKLKICVVFYDQKYEGINIKISY